LPDVFARKGVSGCPGKTIRRRPRKELYKDNLDDAIDGTRDAMNDAEKAKTKVAPPPVRRKK